MRTKDKILCIVGFSSCFLLGSYTGYKLAINQLEDCINNEFEMLEKELFSDETEIVKECTKNDYKGNTYEPNSDDSTISKNDAVDFKEKTYNDIIDDSGYTYDLPISDNNDYLDSELEIFEGSMDELPWPGLKNVDEPYIISDDQVGEASYFTILEYEFYKDNILVDEHGNPILGTDDINSTVGMQALSAMAEPPYPDSICVCNERLQIYFIINKVLTDYYRYDDYEPEYDDNYDCSLHNNEKSD